MRQLTLIGMNHVEGTKGPLPMTLRVRDAGLEKGLDKLVSYGYQKAIVIRVEDPKPTFVRLKSIEP